MATQSKSLLLPFIIIAGLVFVAALGWKFLQPETHNSIKATIIEEPVEEVSQPKTSSTIEVVSYDNQPAAEEAMPILGEERLKAREKAADIMTLSMQIRSPEDALDTLKQYIELGDTKMAETLIDYINQAYPDTVIPAELLDF